MKQNATLASTPPNLVTTLGATVVEDHLKIDYASEATYVDALAAAVVETMERDLGFHFGSGTGIVEMQDLPWETSLPIAADRIADVVVTYIDEDGTEVTIDESNYAVTGEGYPTVLSFKKGMSLSSEMRTHGFPVKITFAFSAFAMPASLEQAAMFVLAHWYENREAVTKKLHKTPMAYDHIVATWKKNYLRATTFSPRWS